MEYGVRGTGHGEVTGFGFLQVQTCLDALGDLLKKRPDKSGPTRASVTTYLSMNPYRKLLMRHCEERSDEAIQGSAAQPWVASLRYP